MPLNKSEIRTVDASNQNCFVHCHAGARTAASCVDPICDHHLVSCHGSIHGVLNVRCCGGPRGKRRGWIGTVQIHISHRSIRSAQGHDQQRQGGHPEN